MIQHSEAQVAVLLGSVLNLEDRLNPISYNFI
jgi:hypothetical protein